MEVESELQLPEVGDRFHDLVYIIHSCSLNRFMSNKLVFFSLTVPCAVIF